MLPLLPQDLLDHDFLHPERSAPVPAPLGTATAALGVTEEQLKTIVSQVMRRIALV